MFLTDAELADLCRPLKQPAAQIRYLQRLGVRALGALPDLHADPGTTARVYERSRESRRTAL